MCGIAGFASARPIPAAVAHRMTELARHRGPDDEGYAFFPDGGPTVVRCGGSDTPRPVYEEPTPYQPTHQVGEVRELPARVGFGHRRLSIIDLSPHGHQPMCSVDSRYWIVYNGEIYNYIEVRDELVAEGEQFFSQSDTEVILVAYKRWGASCLERFNGMWAFAIYDTHDRKLFLARDRFGVKPLYYYQSPAGIFAFASEIKQFTEMPGWTARANPSGVYHFLRDGLSDYSTETLLADVCQLGGGELIEAHLDEIVASPPRPRRWYDTHAAQVTGSLETVAEEFRERFRDSVRLRLRSDVPIGTGLSGGLDSSSIACTVRELLVAEGTGAEQHTFSACANDARFDERRFVEAVVSHTHAHPHFVSPDLDGMLDKVRALVWHHDEPLSGATVFAEWEVFRLASAAGVKVTLDGHGADEILGGYHSFFRPYLAGILAEHRWREFLRQAGAIRALHVRPETYALKEAGNYFLPKRLKKSGRSLLGRDAAHSWIDTDSLGIKNGESLESRFPVPKSIRAFSLQQLVSTSLPPQLRSCDRDSMAHGVESRAPFLDYRVVEFALGCEEHHKIDNGVTKIVLRHAMGQTIPKSIRNRFDKMGFVTPEYSWICESHPELFARLVDRAVERAAGYVKPSAAEYAKDVIFRRRPFDLMVWRLITFGDWMELFRVQ